MIPDGAPGALAELERRKFTAEEGVRISGDTALCFGVYLRLTHISQDHITLLNGILGTSPTSGSRVHFLFSLQRLY